MISVFLIDNQPSQSSGGAVIFADKMDFSNALSISAKDLYFLNNAGIELDLREIQQIEINLCFFIKIVKKFNSEPSSQVIKAEAISLINLKNIEIKGYNSLTPIYIRGHSNMTVLQVERLLVIQSKP